MKILKQECQSLFPHPMLLGGKQWFSVGVMLYFDLMDPDTLLREQDMWQEVPEQLGEHPMLDQGWPKPGGEFLVAGACCAPGKERVQGLEVSVRVGAVQKKLVVLGDRFWQKNRLGGKSISSPIPFSEMPVTWERAFGGEGFALNPTGKGAVEVSDDGGSPVVPLPNIENPAKLVLSPADRPEPAGFGLLLPHYPQRARFAGKCDNKWLIERWPAFPDDLDPRFFYAAPAGQQLPGHFSGDETITIRNMHHEVPVISSRLPNRRIRLFFMRRPGNARQGYLPQEIAGGEYSEAMLSRETLWLLPNILRGVLICRALVPCRDDEYSDIAWTHIVEEDPATEPLPVSHYRDILLEKADFGQNVMMEKMAELQRELGKGAITVRNLPKSFREMKREIEAPASGSAAAPAPFHDRWFPVLQQCRSRLLGERALMEQLTSLGIDEEVVFRNRVGWNDGNMSNSFAGEGRDIDAGVLPGVVIPRFCDARLCGLTIHPEPLAGNVPGIMVPGSEEVPLLLEAAAPGGPLVVVTGELEALLVEGEAGDFADIMVIPSPASPFAGTALHRMAEVGKPVVVLLPGTAVQGLVSAWEKRVPGVRIALFDDAASLFEAHRHGSDLREEILQRLPAGMARQHRLIVPGIADDSLPGTPVEKAMSAEAVSAAVEKGFGDLGVDFASLEAMNREKPKYHLDAGCSLTMASFSKLDMQGIDFSGRDLSMASFDSCDMRGCRFGGSRLEGSMFTACDLAGADLSGSLSERTIFDRCQLAGVHYAKTVLLMVSFTECNLTGTDFTASTLKMVNLRGGTIKEALFGQTRIELSTLLEVDCAGLRFEGTLFLRSMLEKCCLDGVIFSGIETDSLFLHACTGERVRFENSTLFRLRIGEKCLMPGIVMARSKIGQGYFRNANLRGASFPASSFNATTFDGCDLSDADFRMVPLIGCQFPKSCLDGARLTQANLFKGSLRKAQLVKTSLVGANLYGVDFRNCLMRETDLRGANLKRSLINGREEDLKEGGYIL